MMQLENRWRQATHRSMHHSPTITAEGLVLGYETFLIRRSNQSFALADDAERALCLLAILNRRPCSKTVLAAIDRAFTCWERGDKGLAHIHLAMVKLGRLDGVEDARRLFLAESLLDAGMSASDLAAAVDLGLDLPLHKYDQDEPRNPAHTTGGGQWTKNPGAGKSRAFQKPIVIGRAASSLADALGADAIVWLSRFAQRLALPTAVLGAVLLPSPNPGIAAEGDVPGRPDLRYHLDHDTGLLRLSAKDDPDPSHALVAQLGADGVYREVETRIPIARAVGGTAVLIDPDRIPRTDGDATEDDDRPKLCPAPQLDKAGGRKLFDLLYE